MAFPTYTVTDLAQTSGRDASFYSNSSFVPEAIIQATLLFQIGTNRAEPPAAPAEKLLMRLGILHMADAVYLAQPFQEILASPFSSESIGSYSYSKAAAAVAGGLPTGITWFDLAVRQLAHAQPNRVVSGGIEVFEGDDLYGTGHIGRNIRHVPRNNIDPFLLAWAGDPIEEHRGAYSIQTFDDPINEMEIAEVPQVPAAKAVSNITIAQGADTVLRYRYLTGEPAAPVDLSGYTARAQIRESRGGALWLMLATGAGIVLDDQGYITITIPHALTEGTEWNARETGVWDLELTASDDVRDRFLEGTVVVSHDVTRDA